jgi:hypothetical protein
MPESDFRKLDPRAGIDLVGGPTDRGMDRSVNVRHDPTIHHHLDPVVMPPPEPAPVPPDEGELRQRLTLALKAEHVAEENLRRAREAHDRARAHLATCGARFAEFEGLDDQITASTIEALRCSAGTVSPDLSAEMGQRIGGRARAATEVIAATHAAETFLAEVGAAEAAAGQAHRATERVLCAVLAPTATAIAERYERCMAEAEQCARSLAAFDRFTGPRDAPLPGKVREVVVAPPREMRVPTGALGTVSVAAWTKAGETLRADPQAAVNVEALLPTPLARPTLVIPVFIPPPRSPAPPGTFLPVPVDPEATPTPVAPEAA